MKQRGNKTRTENCSKDLVTWRSMLTLSKRVNTEMETRTDCRWSEGEKGKATETINTN